MANRSGAPCDGVTRPLLMFQEGWAIGLGREGAEELILQKKRRKVAIYQEAHPRPFVVYRPCYFMVHGSNFGDVCAAGVTVWAQRGVYVATCDWAAGRTFHLVVWEARNHYLISAGHGDLAV